MASQPVSILVEPFTRLKQTASGDFSPGDLPRVRPFLAGSEGEIHFELVGLETKDAAGGRKQRVKCIISGWFLLFDPETLEPTQHVLSILSSLVLVGDESLLPPLENESPDEDYVALGSEFIVADLVEEEILLDLPFWAIAIDDVKKAAATKPAATKPAASTGKSDAVSRDKKPSAFAKLAALKGKLS